MKLSDFDFRKTIGRQTVSQPARIVLGVISFLVLIGLYSLVSMRAYSKNPNQKTVPGLVKGDKSIVAGVKKILTSTEDEIGWLYQDAAISLKRLGLGVLLGASLAFFTGIAMGCYSGLEALLKPPISFLASIPPTAMMVIYMLLFGMETKMIVAVVGIGIFPTLALSIFQAVKNDIPESCINKAYTLGASPMEVIWEVIIPQILPRIIDAIRLQIGPAMIFLIAVELRMSEGIGFRLRNAPRGNYFNVIYIYLILLGLFGMTVNSSLSLLRRWLCPWFGDAK